VIPDWWREVQLVDAELVSQEPTSEDQYLLTVNLSEV